MQLLLPSFLTRVNSTLTRVNPLSTLPLLNPNPKPSLSTSSLSPPSLAMADRARPDGLLPEKSPSSSQAITVATVFPIGGILLTLSGLILTATIVGFTATLPLFLLFSPVLVPAAALIGFALVGFFVSGAMGVSAVAALSWMVGSVRREICGCWKS